MRTVNYWAALGLLLSQPAFGLEPYMWGVGPQLGTGIIPGRYPTAFPGAIDRATTTIPQLKNDVAVGLQAVYYMNGRSRGNLTVAGDFGAAYREARFSVGYDYILQTGAMDILAGPSVGVGVARFAGEGVEQLLVPNYPFRGTISAVIRDGKRAYQASIFAEMKVPGNSVYTQANGVAQDVGWGFYGSMGAELTLYFGDFVPPKVKRPLKKS